MPISNGIFVMPSIASDGIQVIDVTEDSIRIAGRPYQPVSDQKFAEPVALSSTVSTGFGLPPTTTRYGFDLVTLRARRKRQPTKPGLSSQDLGERSSRNLHEVVTSVPSSPERRFRQNQRAPPTAASPVAIAPLFGRIESPLRPGTASRAFFFATRLPTCQTVQPKTAFRLFNRLIAERAYPLLPGRNAWGR